jgi:hypothetical protein
MVDVYRFIRFFTCDFLDFVKYKLKISTTIFVSERTILCRQKTVRLFRANTYFVIGTKLVPNVDGITFLLCQGLQGDIQGRFVKKRSKITMHYRVEIGDGSHFKKPLALLPAHFFGFGGVAQLLQHPRHQCWAVASPIVSLEVRANFFDAFLSHHRSLVHVEQTVGDEVTAFSPAKVLELAHRTQNYHVQVQVCPTILP